MGHRRVFPADALTVCRTPAYDRNGESPRVQAMRAFLRRSCLITALVGPLLCQAEAAGSLARSLAELAQTGLIEASESGECDGLCLASMKAEVRPGLNLDGAGPSVLVGFPSNPITLAPSTFTPARSRSPGASAFPDATGLRRQARLQTFLF